MEHTVHFAASPDFVCRNIAGEYMLVPVNPAEEASLNNQLISMNETANFLWSELADPVTLEQLVARVKKEFHDSSGTLEKEVSDFVDLLVEKGFVIERME